MKRLCIVFALLAVAGVALAATRPTTSTAPAKGRADKSAPAKEAPAETVPDTKWYSVGLLGWYLDGGKFMVPLFICQVIGLGVIIERLGAYKAIQIDTSAFRAQVKSLLAENKVDEAIKLCDDTPGPVAATLAVGLRKFKLLLALGKPVDQVEAEVSKSIDDYGVHIIAILERHVPILATVCALGPLFGFLGTVDGMVDSFRAIQEAAGAGNIIQVTAGGIKVALYTTVLGLCIGIPTQLFYNIFSGKVNSIVLEVEESANELIQNLALMTALGAHALAEQSPEPAAAAASA